MFRIVLIVVQFISAGCIIALVLIQRGKGADAGAGFGSGASGTVFGARGASTALSRATAIFAAVFMANSLALAYMGTHKAEQPKTILDTAGELPVSGSAPNAVLPGAGANSPPAAPAATPATPAPATPAPATPAPATTAPAGSQPKP